jgi:DNA-binding IclR family transcriptional regulator
LLITATGQVILSYLPAAERNELLRRREEDEPAAVAAFLEQLPTIRETRLAFNRAGTVPRRWAVATPLLHPDGGYVATICAVGGPEIADSLDDVGALLVDAVHAWRWPPGDRRP